MKNMRRSDRLMKDTEAMELLIKGEYGILSTISSENEPYGIPLSYAAAGKKIYFHCAPVGSKLDNIMYSSKVCFTVVGQTNVLPDKFSTEYESVVIFGKAAIVDGDEKISALKELVKKYSPDFIKEGDEYINKSLERTAVVRIDIEDMSGKHRV